MPNSWKYVLNTYSLSSHKKFMSNSWKFVFFDVMDNANK